MIILENNKIDHYLIFDDSVKTNQQLENSKSNNFQLLGKNVDKINKKVTSSKSKNSKDTLMMFRN